MVPSIPTPILGFSLVGGEVLAAEQCCGGCAGRAGIGHAGQPWQEHCAAAMAGVAPCSCPRCFSALGKLQVRSSLGAASQGELGSSWGFCPFLGVGKALFTPHLSWHGHSLQDCLV